APRLGLDAFDFQQPLLRLRLAISNRGGHERVVKIASAASVWLAGMLIDGSRDPGEFPLAVGLQGLALKPLPGTILGGAPPLLVDDGRLPHFAFGALNDRGGE